VFLSPPEIKQQQLREKKGAYERADVDALLDNVVGSYQHVWLERDRLKARVDELEHEIANTKELEKLLRDGLASAQRAAEQVQQEAEAKVSGLVEDAQGKADAVLAEARAQADSIVADSRKERDRLDEETTRLQQANADVRERYKAFLLEALSVVEGTAERKAVAAPDPAVAEADESAPVPEADSEAVLEEAGWLATVPLVAVTADSVDETVTEQAPEPEPEPAAVEQEEEVPATVLLSAVPQSDEPRAEPEPQAEGATEPEPEPEPETLAPEEAYMTYNGLAAVGTEEPPQASIPDPEEDSEDDAYEDWSPKKN
jgi:cell division septum initiation protein DivIVA